MNELQIFENEQFGRIRVVEKDGNPWFVVSDVCKYFGVTNRNRVMQDINENEKGGTRMTTPGGEQTVAIVSEAGLYDLLFALRPTEARGVSKEYIAKRVEKLRSFKHWVTSEVLPSIRKTGSYTLPTVDNQITPESISDEALDSLITNPRFIARLVIMFDKVTKENEKLRIEAKENEGKISYANAVQPLAKEITITELARMLHQLGVADAGSIRLYNWLRENEYLIKRKGNTWNLPTQVYTNAELFMVRTVQVPNQNIIKRQTLVTPKGQEYFIKKFAKAKSLNDVTSKATAVITAINNEFEFDEES